LISDSDLQKTGLKSYNQSTRDKSLIKINRGIIVVLHTVRIVVLHTVRIVVLHTVRIVVLHTVRIVVLHTVRNRHKNTWVRAKYTQSGKTQNII